MAPPRLLHLAVLSLSLGLAPQPRAGEVTKIPNGTDRNQFERIGLLDDSLTIDNDQIHLTGKPLGYFATKTQYTNFTLTFEFKYDRPDTLADDANFKGNSGVLLFVQGTPRVWPDCLEVQLAHLDPGSLFPLGTLKAQTASDPEAQRKALKPVGQWNKVEVTSQEGTVEVKLNDTEVARATNVSPAKGTIAWQSQNHPIHFRQIKIETRP